jgi:hypothetical protein
LLGFRLQGVRHLWEAARMGLGTRVTDEMQFPAMSLAEGIRAFTLAAYGEALDFEHA